MRLLPVFALLLAGLLTPVAGLAQGFTPQQMMDALSDFEHHLLVRRSDLLAAEAEAADPIWIETSDGEVAVFDGADVERQVRSLVFLVQNSGLEDAIMQTLPLGRRIGAALLGAQGREEMAVQHVMAALRGPSADVRRGELDYIDRALTWTRENFAEAMAARDAEDKAGDSYTPAPAAGLVGRWQGCDGRIVEFTGGPGSYQGRYTALGGLDAYGFASGEVGYRVSETDTPGVYQGEVLWKQTGGENPRWVPTTITVEGGTYSDTGADGCSRTMTRLD